MPYAVLPVNMAAASGVARTTMSAFHQDPHWALLWGNMPLEEIIDGNTRRQPRNLITSRERKRHQMVVETETGEVVGYARWLVPDKLQRDDKDGRAVFWPEAQIPEPTPELREKYEAEWKTATKDGHALGSNAEMIRELSVKLDEEDRRIQKGEVFLGMLLQWCSSCQNIDRHVPRARISHNGSGSSEQGRWRSSCTEWASAG